MKDMLEDVHVLVVHPKWRLRKSLKRKLHRCGVDMVAEAEDAEEAAQSLGTNNWATEIAVFDPMQTDDAGRGMIDVLAATGKIKSAALLYDCPKTVEKQLETILTDRGIGFLGLLGASPKKKNVQACVADWLNFRDSSEARSGPQTELALRTPEEIQLGLRERQFTAHFQPEINLSDGRLCAIEALARWQHPTQGQIAPAAFIPVMENHGMIEALTEIVFQRALQIVGKWRGSGHDIGLSVNFSPVSVSSPGFATRAQRLAERLQIPCSAVCLEIAAQAFNAEMARVVHELRETGFEVFLDDYGGIEISPDMAGRWGFSGIKLHRNMVAGLSAGKEARTQLATLIDQAHDAGLTVAVAGIETEEELQCLTQLGCDRAQGYLIGKPMDANKLTGWYKIRYPA